MRVDVFLQFLDLCLGTIRSALRSQAELVIENLALRQQVMVLRRKRPRPHLLRADRVFWVLLRRLWSRWSDILAIVRPETVVRWHRQAFGLYWRWLSGKSHKRRPHRDQDLGALIRAMASDNPTWGAPRIHAELMKLGFRVSERTVSRHLPKRPVPPDARERWKAFLCNHREVLAAMDFFTIPTATFRVLYGFFVVHYRRREIIHFNATEHPSSEWIIQQLREAFPYGDVPRYLIFDRDAKFGPRVFWAVKAMGIEPKHTAYQCPWQNGVAERWIRTVREELLDHVIVLDEKHLVRLVREYVTYYHEDRPHLALAKDTPRDRPAQVPSLVMTVEGLVALSRVGGLHHRYEWRAAA